MSLESPVQDIELELDEDSSRHYTVIELKHVLGLDDSELDKSFEAREADPAEALMALNHYETIISRREAFVGFGNTAFVYKRHPDVEDSTNCVKCRWDLLMVNNKSKKISSLPSSLQPLKRIELYFKDVDDKKRALLQKGFNTVADNPALREAIIQHLAAEVLHETQYSGRVPDVIHIIQIHREESGKVNGDQFAANELVNLIFMDQIQGMTMEEVLYEALDSVAETIDVDKFEAELMEILDILHKAGIVHRDLSIRNIMIDRKTLKPYIIDFGKSAYSNHPQPMDVQRDIDMAQEAARFLRKFKEDPQKTAEELKKRHKD